MDSWNLLIEIVVLLGVALVFGGVLSRLRQSPLVGYLLAGMVLGGPGSLHVVRAEEHIEAIAELGVALLLFSLGLEFSWSRLKSLGAGMLGSGAVQVLVTGAAASAVGLLFRLSPVEAVAVGAMVSLSSTAAVLRVLMDGAEVDSIHGRNSVAILLVQDMAVVPLAILLALLAGSGSPSQVVTDVVKLLVLAAGLVASLYVLLNMVAVRALKTLSLERNRELTVLLAVVVGLGSTWCAGAIGLSPALGAFISGMFLGGSPFATQIRADVSSLRVVLLTLFFAAAGMVADPVWIVGNLGLVIALTVLLVVGKAVLVWLILRSLGQSDLAAMATGLCLAQVGEFAFVLGATAKEGGILEPETQLAIVSSAILTLLLTPYLVPAAPRIARLVAALLPRRGAERQGPAASALVPYDVVIIGFGPAGQAVGRVLAVGDKRVLVLDLNPAAKKAAESLGLTGHVGDALQLDVLEHAHVRTAEMVVITLPARSTTLTVLGHVRSLAPHAHVVVRSRYQRHKLDFESAGAHAVIGDEEEVAKRLSEYVLHRFASRETGDGS